MEIGHVMAGRRAAELTMDALHGAKQIRSIKEDELFAAVFPGILAGLLKEE